jgi:hypothetical protein
MFGERARADAQHVTAALSFRVPYGLDTGAALGVEYSLQYNVAHLTAADLAEVEAAITTQLVHSEATSFEVDAAKLEDVFDGCVRPCRGNWELSGGRLAALFGHHSS